MQTYLHPIYLAKFQVRFQSWFEFESWVELCHSNKTHSKLTKLLVSNPDLKPKFLWFRLKPDQINSRQYSCSDYIPTYLLWFQDKQVLITVMNQCVHHQFTKLFAELMSQRKLFLNLELCCNALQGEHWQRILQEPSSTLLFRGEKSRLVCFMTDAWFKQSKA